MRRALTIARSEFLTSVRARGFLVGILLMPVLFGGAILVQRLVDQQSNAIERRVAVFDGTGQLFSSLQTAVESWNRGERDGGGKVTDGPRFALEAVPPPLTNPERGLAPEQKLQLSERVRAGTLFAFVEIPANLLKAGGDEKIRYYSAAPAYRDILDWLQRSVLKQVVIRRFEQAQVSPLVVASLLKPIATEELGLLDRASDGSVREAQAVDRVRTLGIPLSLMFVLFLVVLMTAPPLMNSVLEEKMSRISEVLLGSVTPFELMAGKLLASTSVSAILSLVYLSGAAYGAYRWGYLDAVEPRLVAWFVLFLLLSVMTFGSIFIALGSACSDLRDAQSLMTPAMMLMMVPAFTWTAVIRAPQSAFAVGVSLFPLATPFLMLLRLSLPERPPAWQLALGVGLCLLTTVLVLWAAGRIVRVGLLMQGKGASFAELWTWIRRG